jgi:transposase InsO family protein
VATRTAVCQLIVGDKTAAVAARFLDPLKKALRKQGITLAGVLTDNGSEFTGKDFKTRAGELGLAHHRIPPRSPNHNAVCERFHGTVLHEFYRPTSTAGAASLGQKGTLALCHTQRADPHRRNRGCDLSGARA